MKATISASGRVVALFALLIGTLSSGTAQVPEIPDYNLPYPAMAVGTQFGPVIYYNPGTLAQMGLEAIFVRAHEYGHVILGHCTFPSDRMQNEIAADRYATLALLDRPDVLAVVIANAEAQGNLSDGLHPTGYERAAMIRAWIQEAGGIRRSEQANQKLFH